MAKTMIVKDLLKLFDPIEILKEISRNYGTLYFEDTCAVFDTYDELRNEDNDPIHRDSAYKYHLELKIVLNSESKEAIIEMSRNKEKIDSRIARYLYYVLTSKGRHYQISKKYVKRVRDFSLCDVEIPDTLTKLDCACLVVLSFAVLNERVIECYGNISSPDYIMRLRSSDDDDC